MKNKFKFLWILTFLLSSLCFSNCKKDEVSDPTTRFVGDYNYVMTVIGDLSWTDSGHVTVAKLATNQLSFRTTNGGNIYYTIKGDLIEENPGQVSVLPLNGGVSSFAENSTGTISGNTLTINGTWSMGGKVMRTFTVIAVKI